MSHAEGNDLIKNSSSQDKDHFESPSRPKEQKPQSNRDYDEFSSGRPLLEHFAYKYRDAYKVNNDHFMPQMIEDILTMLKEHEEAVLANPPSTSTPQSNKEIRHD